MNLNELIAAALVLVVRFGLVWFFGLIGLELDEAILNAIVGAIVSWLLAQFGLALLRKVPGVRNFIKEYFKSTQDYRTFTMDYARTRDLPDKVLAHITDLEK